MFPLYQIYDFNTRDVYYPLNIRDLSLDTLQITSNDNTKDLRMTIVGQLQSSVTIITSAGNDFSFNTSINPSWFIYSEGNKRVDHIGGSSNRIARTVDYTTSGKWYVEFNIMEATSTSSHWPAIGLQNAEHSLNTFPGNDGSAVGVGTDNYFQRIYHDGTNTTGYNHRWSTGDIMSMAWDNDTGDVWFGTNGIWHTGNPTSGGTPCYTEPEFIGERMYPAILHDFDAQTFKIRTETSEMTQTIPTGFTPPGDPR